MSPSKLVESRLAGHQLHVFETRNKDFKQTVELLLSVIYPEELAAYLLSPHLSIVLYIFSNIV